ncbi:transposase, partial [Rhizobium ruizarguesonis]
DVSRFESPRQLMGYLGLVPGERSTGCIGDKSCKAFTYNPKVKWCFLKSDFKTMNAFPGAIAGKIVETAGQQEPDIGAAPRL